jgi:hypothetical protein
VCQSRPNLGIFLPFSPRAGESKAEREPTSFRPLTGLRTVGRPLSASTCLTACFMAGFVGVKNIKALPPFSGPLVGVLRRSLGGLHQSQPVEAF